MSLLDLDEFLLELAGKVALVYSPLVDVKEYPDDVDICLIEGAVCNHDNLKIIRQIRSRTKLLVSFGDCAITANVPAIRNQLGLNNGESVLQRAYLEGAQTNAGIPSPSDLVPALLERVLPVHQVVHVDYFLPGCPPPTERIKFIICQLLNSAEPILEGPQLKFG